MTSKQTTATVAGSAQNGSGHSPCGCHEQPPPAACCCNLVCFDRPNYFCGHLLTDADLTLQQKYVMEKNKLYHRTMDGYGVVCGLKLTCDCDCKGNIIIHDGFAIDDCGNDLVVCEATRFDVIAALKSKGLLLVEQPEDDCEPKRYYPRCDIKQCFYVTICYQETHSDYETPFQSSCTTAPKQCMPTRVHEGVRFDVTDKLPHKHSYLEELEEHIEHCFEINCDSPIGVILKRHAPQLLEIFGEAKSEAADNQEPGDRYDPCELFCTLRAYFLNHLKTRPDHFNCNLYEEVSCLTCPREWSEEWIAFRERRRRGKRVRVEEVVIEEERLNPMYYEELREVFRKLLYYMQRYQYDCVFGDLIFSCPQPCEADCLVLGTVEVMNGKLIRVCNTPRRYLWAPANLLQVLVYSIMSGDFSSRDGCDEKKVPCCPDYRKFEAIPFLREFEVNECGRYHAAKSTIDSLKAGVRAMYSSHEFTDSSAISPEIFARVAPHTLPDLAKRFGLTASTVERKVADLNAPTLQQALQSHALLRRNDSIVAYTSEGQTHKVVRDFVAELSPDRSIGREIEMDLHHARQQSENFANQLNELKAEIEGLKRRLSDAEETKRPPRKGGDKD